MRIRRRRWRRGSGRPPPRRSAWSFAPRYLPDPAGARPGRGSPAGAPSGRACGRSVWNGLRRERSSDLRPIAASRR
ncbi:hypothetical protein G6F46_015662 [Rhizopus delemar]|nr:hypothetical protein G6F46_015662 [Rhizopus delemar]